MGQIIYPLAPEHLKLKKTAEYPPKSLTLPPQANAAQRRSHKIISAVSIIARVTPPRIGATIGIQSGTTGELNIADFFRKNKKTFKPVVIEETKEFVNALESGRVDALTQEASDLALRHVQLAKPDDYVLLPERLSKEPLAPAIRAGDDRWLEIVNWTVYATIQAEEYGITQANIDSFLKSEDPGIKRFLGVDTSLGEAIGLDPKFAYNVIRAVGN